MTLRALVFFVGILVFPGCILMKAPNVDSKNGITLGAGFVLPTPIAMGVANLCGDDEAVCGVVSIPMARRDDDRWIYWKAGTSNSIEGTDQSFARSDQWDMRITRYFPIVGSNGGETAFDEGWVQGQAAFAVVPDSLGSFIPATVADVTGFQFVTDRFESLKAGGMTLEPEFQNPVVNEVGPGLLREYAIRNQRHEFKLSQRIFILRTADAGSYYALRFYFYSYDAQVAAFQWKKLL